MGTLNAKPGPLYSTPSGGHHQGLIIEEGTGATIALTYTLEHAPIIAQAYNAHEEMKEALSVTISLIEMDIVRDDAGVLPRLRAALRKANEEVGR